MIKNLSYKMFGKMKKLKKEDFTVMNSFNYFYL